MKVLVTGGTGFLGKNLQKYVRDSDTESEYIFIGSSCDLRQKTNCYQLFNRLLPDKVIHLAGKVGGIEANNSAQYTFFIDNLQINTNIIEACIIYNVQHLIALSSVCVYPKTLPEDRYPLDISMVFDGPPETTNAGYANAKRAMQCQIDAARKQFPQFKASVVYPANLYGPFDHFGEKGAHVIPDLIHKFHIAKQNNLPYIECLGTGKALRQFTYANDLCEFMIRLSKRNSTIDHNFYSSNNISILELSNLIKNIVGYWGEIRFTGNLDGQYRRDVCGLALWDSQDYRTNLMDGLNKTYQWYLENI